MKKEIYVGTGDYRKLIEDNGYYVDKTLLIEEWMKNKAEVTLITRPRRFGKTLNMTMIREFFDITTDSRDIFEGSKIMDKHECVKFMNKIPVVFYSFKSCDGINKRQLLVALKKVIFSEYERYGNIFKDINKIPKDTFKRFLEYKDIMSEAKIDIELIEDILTDSILLLTQVLYEYYKVKPIVIIDEYDEPFIEAKLNGYYDKVNTTLSSMFCETFKGNKYLDKGILTGIQKIAQESIFSKFNNPSICTVINPKYCDKFGLTKDETKEYLEYFGFELNDKIKKYYDGYIIGNQDKRVQENVRNLYEKGINDKITKVYEAEVYNPMSITSYISNSGALESYWVDTSSNSLIIDELSKTNKFFYDDFDKIINNEECITNVDLIATFDDRQTTSRLWGMFLNVGYITIEEYIKNGRYKIKIPNEEVRTAFRKIISEMMDTPSSILDDMFEALQAKEMEKFVYFYKDILMSCTSYFDAKSKENSYHMLMLGMAAYLVPRFKVESNKERGTGRPDIAIYKKRSDDLNVIIEYKHDEEGNVENNSKHLLEDAKEALSQIKEKKYYTDMDGEVMLKGIAHNKKEAEVLYELITV